MNTLDQKKSTVQEQSRNKKNEAIAYHGIGYVLHVHGGATEALEYYKVAAKTQDGCFTLCEIRCSARSGIIID